VLCLRVQHIAELHGLPTCRVIFQYDDGRVIDTAHARVVYYGVRSVVIELPDRTVTIALPDVIEDESSAHAALITTTTLAHVFWVLLNRWVYGAFIWQDQVYPFVEKTRNGILLACSMQP